MLAEWLRSELSRLGWETGPVPDLSIITYRWAPAGLSPAEVDRINARVVDLVKRDGRVFVSSTTIEGRYMIRFAGLTHRTHLSTVRTLVDVLQQSARVAERELLATRPADMVRSTS